MINTLPLEKGVAVPLWRMATDVECRAVSALFGVGCSTVHKCVCHAIVSLLRPLYLQQPSEQEVEDTARLFNTRWGMLNLSHDLTVMNILELPLGERILCFLLYVW